MQYAHFLLNSSDCNDSSAQKWIINRGETTIQLAGTPFCIDAGYSECCALSVPDKSLTVFAHLEPVSHVGMKLWTCAKKSAGQTFKYDHDNEISLADTSNSLPDLSSAILTLNQSDMCLDLTDGSLENGNQLQIYPCYYNSTNQLWTSGLP